MNRVHENDYRVIQAFLKSLDCPRALTVSLLLKYSEFEQICNLSFNPFDYNDVVSARDSLCATSFLSKYPYFPSSVDTRNVALEKLLDCEEKCRLTNVRFVNRNFQPIDSARMFRMQRKIELILGPLQIERIVDMSGWGPGVTLFNKAERATPFNKFRNNCETNLPLYLLAKRFMKVEYPNWDPSFTIVPANQITTVPKNNRTDRPIAIEPSLNLWFQKGVGSYIRSRLLRFGIDLRNQGTNQVLAKQGSSRGDLATIDFSSASDSISWGLVLSLLPYDWFCFLDLLRSSRGAMPDGSLIEYEKFSSMGNGFTFELESLIFYAAALAVAEDIHPDPIVSIYGDDLICPVDCVDACISFFDCLGFTINTKKSYSSSYYRESCGKHWWNGCDITPIYFRSHAKEAEDLYTIHNNIIVFALRSGFGEWLDSKFLHVAILVKSLCPKKLRLLIPMGLGDLGFISHFDRATPPRCRRYQRGYNIRVRSFRPRYSYAEDHAVLLTRLWCRSYDVANNNSEVIPRLGRYIVSTIFCPAWIEPPSWNL